MNSVVIDLKRSFGAVVRASYVSSSLTQL